MKKATLLLISLCFLFASCGNDPEDEWGRYYGYTQAAIVGHYEAFPDESLYVELPAGMVVYDNAVIDIDALGDNSITLHIVIPDVIDKYFSGPLETLDDRSDITLTTMINPTNKEDIMMTVYTNDKGQVRFHGRVKRYYYVVDDQTNQLILDKSDNWGFDVYKE